MGIWPSAMLKEFSFSTNSSAKEKSISSIKNSVAKSLKKHLVEKQFKKRKKSLFKQWSD